jgi:hypothetical protein
LHDSNNPPAPDELEISIFGPGYGEAILLHVGQGQWVTVDSCIDPINPAIVVPLRYLQDIGVDCSTQVACVIVSHWHDDHIRGLSELMMACKSARFCCPVAFSDKTFRLYAATNANADPSPLGKTTKEIWNTLQTVKASTQPCRHSGPDRLLYSNQLGIELFSLSPSDARIQQFLSRMAASLPQAFQPMRRSPDLNPNDIATALLLNLPGDAVLLGADLEESPGKGWSVILADSQCLKAPASVHKVAHHGSVTGHCDEVWAKLLGRDPIAVTTPWENGGKWLPTDNDIKRISALTPNAYLTAMPGSRSTIRRDNAVERELKNMGLKLSLVQPRAGFVQLRRKFEEAAWRVKTFGTAGPMRHMQA